MSSIWGVVRPLMRLRIEAPTPWTSVPLTLVVVGYGALLLVASDGGRDPRLGAVALLVSLTQVTLLTLVVRPDTQLGAARALSAILPALAGAGVLRLSRLRRAHLAARLATVGVTWLATVGMVVLP